MAEFKLTRGSIDGVQVRGEVFAGTIEGMGAFREMIMRIMREKNVENPKQGEWYDLGVLLSVFDAVRKKGGPVPLEKIGAAVIETAKWPPDINTFEKALNSIDLAYYMNHRRDGKELFDYASGKMIDSGIGHSQLVVHEKERTAEFITDNFYPCAFMKGMILGAANRCKPAGASTVTVTHKDGPCRSKDGPTCTFAIKW
jgi:hypothetical protein